MGTTAQTFFPGDTNWDGTDPASGDVRKCLTSVPADLATSTCDFGTSGSKTITVDPYTGGRTTTGLDSAFGWAIDIAGTDGMDSAADAKRFIPAGTWQYQGYLSASPVASAASCTIGFNVYRVAASPSTTRTLLFSDSFSAGTILGGSGTSYTRTTSSQSKILLEAGETIQITYTLTCTGQVGGLVIALRTGNQVIDPNVQITLPTPGVRTEFPQAVTVTGVGTALRGALAAAHSAQTTAVATASVAPQVAAARTVAVTAVGTASRALNVTVNPVTTTAIATASGFIEIPIDKIPDTSDFSGSDPTAEITGTIYDSAGNPVEGATVKLFRQSDDVKVASTTSAADGTYSFTRDTADPNSYYIAAYDSVTSHGLSDRDVTP